MPSIQDFYFQIILFLAGAIIGVIAQILGTDEKKLKILLATLSFLFIITSIAWTGQQIIATPESTPTLPPLAGKLLFSNDFEDESAHGFNFYTGTWQVVDDGTGNKVLEQNMGDGWTDAFFEPSNFSDGVIEFRFKVISGGDQDQVVILNFRNQPVSWTGYALSYDIRYGTLSLSYYENNQPWQSVESSSKGGSIQIPKGSWITLRVEAREKSIKAFVNGNPIIVASDSRLSQGELGISTSKNLVVQFDDFKVWDMISE